MTTKRDDKRKHQAIIATAGRRGYTEIEFASPRLRGAAHADRGHCLMTRREYIATRMGRGEMIECRLTLAIELRARRLRSARLLGGRRVGCGKWPQEWRATDAERELTRRK